MNSNKFEGCMHLLDYANDRAEQIKDNNKALANAERNLKQCINEIFHGAIVGDRLLETIQYYVSNAQVIVYLIGVENGVCIQSKKPESTAEEDILKNIMPRVEACRAIHKFYNKSEKELNEFLDELWPTEVESFKKTASTMKSLIQKYANHMQEVTYMIGIEDGMKLQKSLESGVFAINFIKETYEQFEDEKEAAQPPGQDHFH